MKKFISLSLFTALLFSMGTCTLMSCTKEQSFECAECIRTSWHIVGHDTLSTYRQNMACGKAANDTAYWRGDTLIVRKTVCK